MRRICTALVALLVLTGCGGNDDAGSPERLTLALDFTPNAVHAPLYAAADEGAFDIQVPGQGPTSLQLVTSGRADLGVLDIHDLAIARAEGADVVAFAALVDRPLAALAARPSVERPRDLEGRTVGVSGLPSDPAFLNAVVAHDGGDPGRVETITIGFTAVARLLSGRVDAAPIFWNAEGVVLRRRGLDVREFRVDDYGAPRYPELVLIARPERVDEVRAVLDEIEDGIATAREDPEAAAERIAAASGAGDVGLVRAQVDAISAAWELELDRAVLEDWAAFDARIGIVDAPPDVDTAFDLP